MNTIYSVDGGFNLPIYSFTSGILGVRLPWLDRKYVNFDQQDNSSNQFSYLVYTFQNSEIIKLENNKLVVERLT